MERINADEKAPPRGAGFSFNIRTGRHRVVFCRIIQAGLKAWLRANIIAVISSIFFVAIWNSGVLVLDIF